MFSLMIRGLLLETCLQNKNNVFNKNFVHFCKQIYIILVYNARSSVRIKMYVYEYISIVGSRAAPKASKQNHKRTAYT